MIELDNDLQSRQNARELVRNAKKAQAILAAFSQQQIDAIVKNVAQEAAHHAEALAKMAAEETGFGNWQDKVLKNRFASLRVYDAIKDMKTVGIIHDDPVKKSDGRGRAAGRDLRAGPLNEPNLHGYLQSADRPQGRQRHYLLPASGRASVQLEGD